MKSMTRGEFRMIEERYNPEYDVPQNEPQVTWVDWYLKRALEDAFAEIEELRKRIDALSRGQ